MSVKIETLESMAKKQSLAYVATLDEGGFPHIRAMQPRLVESLGAIWFSTNISSKHVEALKKDSRACLYFCDKRFFKGLALQGHMEILDSPQAKEKLWKPADSMFYPGGITDPDYCVLRFTAHKANYYNNLKNTDFDLTGK